MTVLSGKEKKEKLSKMRKGNNMRYERNGITDQQ